MTHQGPCKLQVGVVQFAITAILAATAISPYSQGITRVRVGGVQQARGLQITRPPIFAESPRAQGRSAVRSDHGPLSRPQPGIDGAGANAVGRRGVQVRASSDAGCPGRADPISTGQEASTLCTCSPWAPRSPGPLIYRKGGTRHETN